MALKKNVLNSYFKIPPKTDEDNSAAPTSVKEIKQVTENNEGPKFYRIFDDPIRNDNLGQNFEKPKTNIRQNNLEQTSDKLKSNLGQNLGQTLDQNQDIPKTKLGHGNNISINTSDKLKSETRTIYRPNISLNQDKLRTDYKFSSLNFGLQRTIVLFIHDCCKQNRDKVTPPLSIEYVAQSCNTSKLSAQKTIQRLEKKRIIIRKAYQNGRGGWTQYELPEAIYQEILLIDGSNNFRINLGQNQDNVRLEPRTQTKTNSPSSSSNNLDTTTTMYDLPPEWDEIDLSELAKRNIRFSKQHLAQVYPYLKDKHASYEVQESIDAFVYDLDNKYITIRISSVGMLLKIFRAGELYISNHYVSSETKLLLENAERAKQRKQQLEEAKYQEWLAKPENQEKIKRNLPVGMLIPYEHDEPQAHNYIREFIYEKNLK